MARGYRIGKFAGLSARWIHETMDLAFLLCNDLIQLPAMLEIKDKWREPV